MTLSHLGVFVCVSFCLFICSVCARSQTRAFRSQFSPTVCVQGSNSGRQTWWRAPIFAKLSCLPGCWSILKPGSRQQATPCWRQGTELAQPCPQLHPASFQLSRSGSLVLVTSAAVQPSWLWRGQSQQDAPGGSKLEL